MIFRLFFLSSLVFISIVSRPVFAQANNNQTKTADNYLAIISKNGILRWPAGAMPLQIYIKPGDTINGYRPVFITLLEQAFSEWAAVSPARISFALTKDLHKAQVICSWTSDQKEMTQLSEGGHALVIPDGHNIKRVEIIIMTKTTKGDDLSNPFFKRVALHEIGHTLGITDHSPDPNDMMYGAPLPSTTNCTLTPRDKNTLVAIYNLNQTAINRTPVNIANLLPAQNNQSNLARVIRLNAEAAQALQKKDLAVAITKLEQAHQISPSNDLINSNLGSAYGNCAMVACLIRDNKRAQMYFEKALPLLAGGPNKENYISILKSYESFLRNNNRIVEAEEVEKKIETLSTR